MSIVFAAWGGGVNSTAMVVEWLRRELRLDIVLFADTGGEKPETYAYRDVFAAWLKKKTKAPFVTVTYNGKDPTLEAELLRLGNLPSIAYGGKTCSQKWKRTPQEVFLNNWEPAQTAWARGEKVTKLVGYDSGESHRAKPREDAKYHARWPLIEWDMDRDDCVAAIECAGLAVPPKSACFFCPSSRKQEVFDLRDKHPKLIERALAIESNANLRPGGVAGLGRHFSWRDLLERDRRQGKLWDPVPSIPCDCFDGDEP